MANNRICEECGAELPANAPQGLCPRCLAGAGLRLLPTETLPASDFQIERTGVMIGRYKLLEKIGEGGFGVVYMAEQVEPVQRKVALKIIKAGMDTREVIARFEAERQAIALMDHPNIARALDAGATEAGRPYFVMELVRGIPITEYCDQANLPTPDRVQLFIKVCNAVQHAHQKGVIHRDLKPSNVLVTEHDGEPVPKVIDFGVAKALGQKLTERTLFTGFQHMIGTPAYMSPEQAALSGLDIDTRADIYSLGVLLYELLTGATPFDAETFRKAELDEIRRMIRETEPPKPSTRLRTLGDKLPEVARHRHTEPAALNRLIRGDLDWIVMKCLEKDRKRRYETANGLAMDLARHLKNEPVVARPASKLYRFQKVARRNKLAFAAAMAVGGALVCGLGVSTLLFFKEREARRRAALAGQKAEEAQANEARLRFRAEGEERKAQNEAAKSALVARLLQEMLSSVRPAVAQGRDTGLLREILDKMATRLGKDPNIPLEAEAELRGILGKVYYDLGDFDKSEAMRRGSLTIWRKIAGNDSLEVAESLGNLGLALWQRHKLIDAESADREALEVRTKLQGKESAGVATLLNNLGLVLVAEGRLPEAEAKYGEALALRLKFDGGESEGVAVLLMNLALAIKGQGRLDEAANMQAQAVTMYRKLLPPGHPDLALPLQNLADALAAQDKLAEAESLFREVLEIHRQAWANVPGKVEGTVTKLARLLVQQRRYEQAEQLFNSILTPEAQDLPQSAGVLVARGEFLARRSRFKEAAADLSKATTFQPDNHLIYHSLLPLLALIGDTHGYRIKCAEELARFGKTSDPSIADRMAKDCLLLPDSGVDRIAVVSWAETAVTAGKGSRFLPWFQFSKGLAEYREGHYSAAADSMQQVLLKSGQMINRDVEAYMVLALAQYGSGQLAQAQATLAKGIETAEARLPKLDGGDLGDGWIDRIVAHILMTEAKGFINNAPKTSDP